MPTFCTFNANNLFVRYQFDTSFPGDRSGKSLVENPNTGYLPVYNPALFEVFNETQRKLAARVLTNNGKHFPDVICLQEIESLIALRKFNEVFLREKYPFALLIDSRDFRQIDVGILSRLKILDVRTHLDDIDVNFPGPPPKGPPNKPRLFSRDCLEVELALNKSGTQRLTLFINHLKSKFSDTAAEREKADKLRKRQAKAVLKIVHERFPGAKFDQELFAVVGDFNDEPLSTPVLPLTRDSGLINAVDRLSSPEDRWTYWYRGQNAVSQIDYLLLSPALDAATAGVLPRIERRGISFATILADGKPGPKQSHLHRSDGDPNPILIDFRFPRFKEVTREDYASDHCPVFLDIP
jgi:endonuclease/exonuclease/phosphatase family metal-dependent hydrolase